MLDLSIAVVDLDEVYFDTFHGGSIPLSQASNDDILGRLDRNDDDLVMVDRTNRAHGC